MSADDRSRVTDRAAYERGWERVFGQRVGGAAASTAVSKTADPGSSPGRLAMPFSTVGALRKVLDGVPDDRLIICQVVAADGRAWNMWGEFCPQAPHGTVAVLTLRHDELKTLPEVKE